MLNSRVFVSSLKRMGITHFIGKRLKTPSLLVIFILGGTVLLSALLYSRVLVSSLIGIGTAHFKGQLVASSVALAALATAEELDMFRVPEDAQRPEWKDLTQRLVDFADRTDVLYAYYLRVEGDKVQFIADNDSNEETRVGIDTSPEELADNLDIAAVWNGDVKVFVPELGAYARGWHGLISSYAPVFDSNGKVAAIAGVDYSDLENLKIHTQNRIFWIFDIFALLTVFACGVFGLIIFRREANAAQSANASKTRFLSRMSHELRTPLNAMIGMSELALREEMSPLAYEHIVTVKHAGQNLLGIVNEILDISKIESGKMEIILGEYSFSSMIKDVISIIRIRAASSKLQFIVNIDSNIPDALHGDEIKLRQALLNILSNAVKYTPTGFVSLTVSGEMTDDNTLTLTMAVEDSGRGLKPEDIGKLFKDYVQFDQSANKGIEGTGLGLAITYSFIKAMGGDINVDSEHGKGSTFTVTLPQKICGSEKLAVV